MEKNVIGEQKFLSENNPESLENQAKVAVLHEIFDRVYNIDNMDEIVDFVEKIKLEHPDYGTYRLYHLLAGSTVNPEMKTKVDKFDLPGNEIENFLYYLDRKNPTEFSIN